MTLPVQTIIDTHEALSDWRFTAQEANQIIASVWESIMGAIALTAAMGMFGMAISNNPSGEQSTTKRLSKKTIADYSNRKLYHVSPVSNLEVLEPSMPAEDIINGEVVWDIRYAGFVSGKIGLPESSKCVCFAADLEATLAINALHNTRYYIYVPETNEVPRAIWKEVKEELKDVLTVDFVSVKEYRFYEPVKVKLVGEVWIGVSDNKIHWYSIGKVRER